MKNILFLLGAGFNKDARSEAGKIIGRHLYKGEYVINVDYPLVKDIRKICFGEEKLDSGQSVEEKISKAILGGDYKPIKRLYEEIMRADFYLVPKLLSSSNKPLSCYAKFFAKFQSSSFLTFNYDSLVEVFLLRSNRWHPSDGYGVPVITEIEWGERQESVKARSKSFVLHLHGSLCIYSVEFDLTNKEGSNMKWIVQKHSPDFVFDPDSISDLFIPYERVPPVIGGYTYIENRVIAPVPDKAEGLKGRFFKEVHSKAKLLLENAEILVSIVFSFNLLDKSSYEHLIQYFSEFGNRKVIIIAPDASDLVKRLEKLYQPIEWMPIGKTFKHWVDSKFLGIDI